MTTQAIVQLPLEQLIANPQVRQHFDAQAEEGMAQSIREVGIMQPIRVRRHNGKAVIIDGERRCRAAKRVGLATVPVIFEEVELDPSAIIQRQLIANCQREDLRPLELATSIAQLIKSGCSQTEAAKKLGMPDAKITRTLAILALPVAMREQVNSGQIPASAAYELAKIKDSQRQAELASQLVAGQLTRDGLTGAIKAQKVSPPKGTPKMNRVTLELANGRRITVVAPGLNMEVLISMLAEVSAIARKGRTRGVELPTLCRIVKDNPEF